MESIDNLRSPKGAVSARFRSALIKAREWFRGGNNALGGHGNGAHPLADGTRVRKIIDGLPYSNAWQTLEDVNHWLTALNAEPGFGVERRFQLADQFDTATRKCQAQLRDAFFALRGDNLVEEKRLWKTLTEFWTLLGDAYLACARQCGDGMAPQAMQNQLPVLAARGLHAMRQQIQCALLRYGAVRTEIWAECGAFVALAESAGCEATRVALYAGNSSESSPNNELARLAMFWTLSPNGLSPAEQDIAERLVAHLADKCRLSAFQERTFDYFFDLAGTHPPLRLVRSSPWSPQTRYFELDEAYRSVRVMHGVIVSTGQLPTGINLGVAADAHAVARVLNHMLLNWAKEMPARAAERRRADMALSVVQGYQSVLNVLAPAHSAPDEPPALLPESWVTNDVSAGGYGVIVPAGAAESLHVGNMIAVRPVPDVTWHLGIIRRVQAYQGNRRHIGIQLISKSAGPIELRTLSGAAHGGKLTPAIVLDAETLADGNVDILVRRDLLSGREAIEAKIGEDGAIVTLSPGGVVEHGHDFDWLRFCLPSRLPRGARSRIPQYLEQTE